MTTGSLVLILNGYPILTLWFVFTISVVYLSQADVQCLVDGSACIHPTNIWKK